MSEAKTKNYDVEALRAFYGTHIQALQGVLDKLPEPMRAGLIELKAKLNAQLETLKPIDQVPAAQEAGWALSELSGALSRIQEYAKGLMERLQGMSAALATRATEFNTLTESVAKEYLKKDLVEGLTAKAREEGVASVMPSVIALRKGQVELAGLPMASDAVLGGSAEDFGKALDGAKANLAALSAKGMKLGGKGDAWVKQTVWLGQTEFAGQMTVIDELVPPARPEADPLLGAGGAGTEAAPKAGRRVRVG